MGNTQSQSAIRSASALLVEERRENVSEGMMRYINTKEFVNFYKNNSKEIRKEACNIYGYEIQTIVKKNEIEGIREIVDEIDKFCREDSKEIYYAVNDMVESRTGSYKKFIEDLHDYITTDTLLAAVIASDEPTYNYVKQYAQDMKSLRYVVDYDVIDKGVEGDRPLLVNLIAVQSIVSTFEEDTKESENIMIDVLDFMAENKYLPKIDIYNSYNRLAKALQSGSLKKVYGSKEGRYNFKIPDISRKWQRDLYGDVLKPVLSKYQKPSYYERAREFLF